MPPTGTRLVALLIRLSRRAGELTSMRYFCRNLEQQVVLDLARRAVYLFACHWGQNGRELKTSCSRAAGVSKGCDVAGRNNQVYDGLGAEGSRPEKSKEEPRGRRGGPPTDKTGDSHGSTTWTNNARTRERDFLSTPSEEWAERAEIEAQMKAGRMVYTAGCRARRGDVGSITGPG